MATQLQVDAGVRKIVASEVSEALTRYQPTLTRGTASNTAQIVAVVAAAVIGLSSAEQKRLKTRYADLAAMIENLAHETDAPTKITIPAPTAIEGRKGAGLGELIDLEEGQRRVALIAEDVPLEEWAGPVAGSSAVMNELGIARSTLHDWQKRRQVIALRKGANRHVFPLSQFVDGRPAHGIGDVLEIIGSPRRAWFWLMQASPLLGGKTPITMLRLEKVALVIEAARAVFDRP